MEQQETPEASAASVALARPTEEGRAGWRVYWRAAGQPWRTEPEIDAERQAYLAQRRGVPANVAQGSYPFGGATLTRADVEWLLATHEGGRGPVEWADTAQREREGLDLRGADLRKVDLRELPLARMRGGIRGATPEQLAAAAAHLERADLRGTHLEGADLRGAALEGADLRRAQLEEATLAGVSLARADLREARLERADLREVHAEGVNLEGAQLREARLDEAHLARARLREARLETLYVNPREHSVTQGINPAEPTQARTASQQVRRALLDGRCRARRMLRRHAASLAMTQRSGLSVG